jgi:hypothetical protein
MQSRFEFARNMFRPDTITMLFVAQAPPALSSRRFFYFVPVSRGDGLFLEMMKVLYKDKFVSARDARQRKEWFLTRFRDDGST